MLLFTVLVKFINWALVGTLYYMVIAIDARAYAWTGIGRYIRNLLREYGRLDSAHSFLVLIPRGSAADFSARVPLPSPRFTLVEVEPSYYSLAEQTRFLFELNSLHADLFHFTHFNVPLLFSRPYVVTIHDTTRFIFPGQKKQGLLQQMAYEMVFSHGVSSARAVACVSKTTKQELLGLGLSLPATIEVIYEGVSDEFLQLPSPDLREQVRKLLKTRVPYLLYVGVWMSHKNLLRLIQAFALVKKKRPDVKLVITGKEAAGQSEIIEVVTSLGLKDEVLFPGFVPAELLPALYAEAELFCFPSLYEGFGLPPLEAAGLGTPVVTSNVSSLPEIMGNAAQYVNPEDVNDMADGIVAVLNDDNRQRQLIEAGRKRVQDFTWEKCAIETLGLYEAVRQEN